MNQHTSKVELIPLAFSQCVQQRPLQLYGLMMWKKDISFKNSTTERMSFTGASTLTLLFMWFDILAESEKLIFMQWF